MAENTKPDPKNFKTNTPEGQKAFEDAMLAWEQSQKTEELKEVLPSKYTKRVYLVSISDKITRNERPFRMLTISDPDGVSSQTAINENYYNRVAAQLKPENYYEFEFEVRKAGITTYKDAQGKMAVHKESGENMTKFTPITEKAFAGVTMSWEKKKAEILGAPSEYSQALAFLLK